MYKAGLTGFAVGLLCTGLIGCQMISSSPKTAAAQPPSLSAAKVAVLESPTPKGLASLHCTGAVQCEFAKLNNLMVINEVTHQPTSEAVRASVVRLENPGVKEQTGAGYFINFRPGRNEVKVRFYPITRERAENFSLIHDFRPDKTYRLNMFRKRSSNAPASLLNTATPDPLCVDLLENDKVQRRFCRPFGPATGLGEFLEQPPTS